MLLSKDIINDDRWPYFIRKSSIFKKYHSFDKVFPLIGLENFECELQEIKHKIIPFIPKSIYFGVRCHSIASYGFGAPWSTKLIGMIACTIPFYIINILLDALFLHDVDKKLKIVFSSAKIDGAWDIATMSMRGITSCQSWTSSRAHHLIGSIIDPCCAIMYITNDKEFGEHGREMLYRTVVRFVVHKTMGPCLFMEQMYSSERDVDKEGAVGLLFATLLHKRTKLPIIYNPISKTYIKYAIFIPETDQIKNSSWHASYRDSGIQYSSLLDNSDIDINQYPSLIAFKQKFLN